MRRAHQDYGWIEDNGHFAGLSLGYDHCYEHEHGIEQLTRAFDLLETPTPQGIEERTARRVPQHVCFVEYEATPRDKRRKRYPAAVLAVFTDRWDAERFTGQPVEQFVKGELAFYGDPGERAQPEPRDDIACAWDSAEFAVHVRGEENLKRLRALHEAIQARDIALATPWARAFFRGGLSLALASAIPQTARAAVLAQDQAHKALVDAAAATGVHETLKAAGCGWYALSPDWLDPQDPSQGLKFFLNPQDQKRCNHGWFTTEELLQWARGEGVVLKDARLEAFAKANPDFGYNLVVGMKAQGLFLRAHEVLTWVDAERTTVGARLLVARDSQARLPSGVYPVETLMRRFPVPAPESSAG